MDCCSKDEKLEKKIVEPAGARTVRENLREFWSNESDNLLLRIFFPSFFLSIPW